MQVQRFLNRESRLPAHSGADHGLAAPVPTASRITAAPARVTTAARIPAAISSTAWVTAPTWVTARKSNAATWEAEASARTSASAASGATHPISRSDGGLFGPRRFRDHPVYFVGVPVARRFGFPKVFGVERPRRKGGGCNRKGGGEPHQTAPGKHECGTDAGGERVTANDTEGPAAFHAPDSSSPMLANFRRRKR